MGGGLSSRVLATAVAAVPMFHAKVEAVHVIETDREAECARQRQRVRPELLARVEEAQRRYDAARGKGSLASLPRPLGAAWSDFTPIQRHATVTDLIAEVRVDSRCEGSIATLPPESISSGTSDLSEPPSGRPAP